MLFISLKSIGQTTGYLRFDTVRILKQGGTSELYLINSTKDSLGQLTNVGGGLTRFIKPKKLNDSTLVIGLDTISLAGNTQLFVPRISSTDQEIVRFNGTTGDIQGTPGVTANGSGNFAVPSFWTLTNAGGIQYAMLPLSHSYSTPTTSSTNTPFDHVTGAQTQSSGNLEMFRIATNYNQTSTAGATDFLIRRTETAIGSGQHNFLRFDGGAAGTTERFSVDRLGRVKVGQLDNGTASDSVVVWDASTKYLKKVLGSGLITASNGLTKTVNDIQLGGFLNQNTLIDGNDTYTWRLLGATQISFSAISGGADDGDITFSAADTIHMNASYHKFNFLSRNAAGFMKPILYDTINHLIYYGDVSTSGGSSGSAYGIDSTVISGTTGSVLFVGTGPVLAQDNANFFWDNSTKRLGIGTASPARSLHVSLADAATNSVTSMGRWTHSTSGTAAAGFGLNREIYLENASGTDISAATEVFSWSDATNASEDAAWTLNLVRGGSLAQAATISSLGALTIGNSLVASGSATIGASNSYIFSGRSSMNSSTNGDINLFNNAQNGFGRLNFGGTSSSFPALLRSSANLIVRLADNSANTDLEVLDEAYDATTWNGSNEVPTKNATRDKIEGMNIVQGTYTPTLTNGANVDASTVPGTTLYYKREGNQVTVWGMVTIDPNASAATTVLSISLPIASALTSYTQLSGQATGNIVAGAYFGGFIQGDDTNDRAQLDFVSGTTLNQTWSIRFTYEIL